MLYPIDGDLTRKLWNGMENTHTLVMNVYADTPIQYNLTQNLT